MTTIVPMRAMIHPTRTAPLPRKVRKRRIITMVLISVWAFFVGVNI